MIKFGSTPQRAHAPWFTNVQHITRALVLPDVVTGPSSIPPTNSTLDYRSLEGSPDEFGLLDGISPHFRSNDNAYFHCHVDLALNRKRGDAAGIAMGREIGSWVESGTDGLGVGYQRIVRSYEVPLVAQIRAHSGDQIYLNSITRLILQLKQLRGFNITSFSFDGFQSAGSMQELALAGLVTAGMRIEEDGVVTGMPKPFSVDGRSAQPYTELLEAANEGRVKLPRYELLRKELRELEVIAPGAAPDHPLGGCFTGETRVPLLDGTTPRIDELVGREAWVYSATPAGDLVPGRARGRLTKRAREVVDVTLDDGHVVRCTPEHLWMLRNGTYKEAQGLVPGVDRLMPCKRFWPVNGGYERYTTPRAEKRLTHRLICEAAHGPIPSGWLVHHIDEMKTNNTPGNLEAKRKFDHNRDHALERHSRDPGWRETLAEGTRRFNATRDYATRVRSPVPVGERGTRFARRHDVTIDSLPREGSLAAARRELDCGRNVIMRVLRNAGYSSWQEWLAQNGENHKVRRVDRITLAVAVPVYDLEVDVWSNFAIDAGCFVHNSKDVADPVAGVVGYLAAFGHAVLHHPLEGAVFGREDLGLESVPNTLGVEGDNYLGVGAEDDEDSLSWDNEPLGAAYLGVEE